MFTSDWAFIFICKCEFTYGMPFLQRDMHSALNTYMLTNHLSTGFVNHTKCFLPCYSQRWTRNEAIRHVEPRVQYGARDMPEALSLCHISLWPSLPLRQVSWLPRWLYITPRCPAAKLTAACVRCGTGTSKSDKENFFILLCQPEFWRWIKGVDFVIKEIAIQ